MPWNPFAKMRMVKCLGDREIRVYKNPQKAFPLYAKDWSTQFKGAVNAATQLSTEIGGEFAKRMSGLLIVLDETNGSMQLKLSAIYQYYSEDPCNREHWFERNLTEMFNQENRLKTAKIELTALRLVAEQGADQGHLLGRVEKMIERLSISDIEHSRRIAFDNAFSAVDAWQREN